MKPLLLGSFKGVVLELNWVSKAVLSTDYDGVSLFSKKNPGLYEKEAKSCIKNG